MDAPITTAAIYYDDRTPVKNFSDALAVVLAGLSRLDKAETPLVGIRHPTIKAKDVSSVAGFPLNEEGRKMLMVYREGAVEHKRIVDIAGRLTPRDVEEWT
ncbi:hypothetical protein A6V29_15980 [Blastococcus sp. CCUG 61487]|nr:hypothetical protein A6V29_15980 [Blastococcus sp. CCUG 61487]